MKDPQSRKWQITINNPAEKNLKHDEIKVRLEQFKSVVYYCLADEVGLDEKTPHTHVFMQLRSPVRFGRLKKVFPDAHIERARGSALANKEYIEKSGKWAEDAKADTSIPNTFEEWGEIPEEPGQGYRSDLATLYACIADGMSNAEIIKQNPEMIQYIGKMDKIRQDILEDRYQTVYRELNVTYIFGPTETGKTRGVMEEHGYGSVYRVTDYKHPFDRYSSQPVICFDEFRSSLSIGDMLNYLDGYPLALTARYANRQACYDTVYIVSNIDLRKQYLEVQHGEKATWLAFLRRISDVVEYRRNEEPIHYGNATEYVYPAPKEWVQETIKETGVQS